VFGQSQAANVMFPFYVTNIAGMQAAQIVHATVAVLFIAVMIAHAYIGTIGMEARPGCVRVPCVNLVQRNEANNSEAHGQARKADGEAIALNAVPTPPQAPDDQGHDRDRPEHSSGAERGETPESLPQASSPNHFPNQSVRIG
jgi:hypothetical protein